MLFATSLTAQVQNKWIRVGLFSTSIVLNAVGDGLYDEKKKLLSKSFRAGSIATLLAVPLVTHVEKKDAVNYVVTFSCLRYTLFDAGYNLTRNLPYDYMGTTSHHDRILGKIPKSVITATKGISLGIVIYLNKNQ